MHVLFFLSSVSTSSTSPLRLARLACAAFATTAVSPSGDWFGEVARPVAIRFGGKWPLASDILLADAQLEVACIAATCCCCCDDCTTMLSPPRNNQPTTGSRRWLALSLYTAAACRHPSQAAFVVAQAPLHRLCSVSSSQPLWGGPLLFEPSASEPMMLREKVSRQRILCGETSTAAEEQLAAKTFLSLPPPLLFFFPILECLRKYVFKNLVLQKLPRRQYLRYIFKKRANMYLIEGRF